jgi:LacI family transcriptional regulator
VPVIGVVFHDMDLINSELHLLIQSGVQAEAQRRGYQVRMSWTHVPDEIEEFERGCDALVMVGPHDRQSYARVYGVAKPAVRTGWVDPLEPVDWVGGTDHEAGSAVANYLLGLGHRVIAFVHGTPGYRGRAERFYGLREVLEKRSDVQFREMKFATEVRFTDALLQLHASGFRPTAFFCAHDGLGVTAISELLRLGYHIPEDIPVVGFGDYSSATQISPRLTSVCGFGQQMGAACVRMLDDRIHNRLPVGYPLRTMVTARIIERDSSGPMRQPVPSPAIAAATAR